MLIFHCWTEMDNFERTDASGSNTQGATVSITQGTSASNTQTATGSKAKSLVCWTNSMSTMMLGFLADLVASGKRTSSGFKQCHHNQCAQVLNEHFKLSLNHDQISNHLKKWRKIWGRLIQLKNLSGALWDEDTCTIRLSEEHYAGHCAVSFIYYMLFTTMKLCVLCASHLCIFCGTTNLISHS
jgi:hypothetical protein